jgi:hypothetical protein
MPISEDTLKALRGMPSQAASADDGPSDQAQQLDAINEVKTGAKPPADEIIPKAPPRTNNWKYIAESMKRGASGIIGLPSGVVNWAINRVMPFTHEDVLPGFVQSIKNAEDAFGVDREALERGAESPWASAAGTMLEGAVQLPLGYVRYAQPVAKAAQAAAPGILGIIKGGARATAEKLPASDIIKNASVSSAAQLGADLGGKVGGGIAEAAGFSADAGRTIGSIFGGSATAPLGAVRANAVKEGAGVVKDATQGKVGGAFTAARAAWKEKKENDATSLTDAFFRNYGILGTGGDMGMVEKHVAQRVANIVSANPDAKKSLEEFDDLMGRIGRDRLKNSFSFGARTEDPTIQRLETQRRVDLPEEQKRAAQDRVRREELTRLYKDVADGAQGTSVRSFEQSLEALRLQSLDDITGFKEQEFKELKSLPNWNPTQAAASGAKLRGAIDTAEAESKGVNKKMYDEGIAELDAAGGIDLSSVIKTTEAQLKDVLTQVMPDKAKSPQLKRLDALIKGEKPDEPPSGLILPPGVQAPTKPREPTAFGGAEIDDLVREFSDQANAASKADNSKLAENLNAIKKAILGAVDEASVGTKYGEARKRFREQHSPAFKEGLNVQVSKESGGLRQGLDKIPDEQLVYKYLDASKIDENMKQFDNAFSGKMGIAPRPEAYQVLGEGLSSIFARDVASKGKMTDEAMDAFFKTYGPALERVPAARKLIEEKATRLMALQNAQENVASRFKDLVDGPIGSKIGDKQADEFFSKVMSDPVKLNKLIHRGEDGSKPGLFDTPNKARGLMYEFLRRAAPVSNETGALDYTNFVNMMELGKRNPDNPGTLRMLANAAFGPKVGEQFINDLRDVSAAFSRDVPDPRLRRLADPTDAPVRASTGGSTATHATDLKALSQGRVSPIYTALHSGGRFINARIMKHVQDAESKALHDPDMMAAIAEMARTPSNMPVSGAAIDKVFGTSAALVKTRLLDMHLLKEHARGGATIGAAQAGHEEVADKERGKTRTKDTPLFR